MAAQKILWIEDDDAVGALYADALVRAGYDVTLEADGQKGLELARAGSYDFILLDLMLPGLSGSDILKALRSSAGTPQTRAKIIIITNLEQRPEVRLDIERHADAYLIKAEVTPRQLANFLAQLS